MGKAPLPHKKRNCYPPYPDHYLNIPFRPSSFVPEKELHARVHACRGLKELPDGMMGFVVIVTRARNWRILRFSFTVSRSAVP